MITKEVAIFTIVSDNGFSFIEPIKIFQEISKIIDLKEITSIFQARNNKFMGIEFSSNRVRDLFVSKFLIYENSIVLQVWRYFRQTHDFRIHWVPPNISIEKIKVSLAKHLNLLSIERENILIAPNVYKPSSVYKGSFKLLKETTLDSLPHIFSLSGGWEVLLTIAFRQPLCLKCKQIGHIRKSCTYNKCKNCLAFHDSRNMCSERSYSSVLTQPQVKSVNNDLGNESNKELHATLVSTLNSNSFMLQGTNTGPSSERKLSTHPIRSVSNELERIETKDDILFHEVSSEEETESQVWEEVKKRKRQAPSLNVKRNKASNKTKHISSNTQPKQKISKAQVDEHCPKLKKASISNLESVKPLIPTFNLYGNG